MTKIGIKRIVLGMYECCDNARKLSRDARALFGRRRYSSASALAITSLEEIGKVFMLVSVGSRLSLGGEVDWSGFWRVWRSHQAKHAFASILDMEVFGEDAAELAVRTLLLMDLGTLRSRALYVDWEKGKWIHPRETSKRWTRELVEAAESLAEELSRELRKPRLHLVEKELAEMTLSSFEDNPLLQNLAKGFSRIQKKLTQIAVETGSVKRGIAM